MPSSADVPVNLNAPGEDLFPEDGDEQNRIVTWVQRKFNYADSARKPQEERWLRYYKAYRSYVAPRKPGEWKSNVWMPMSFYVIETVLPRLAAQLPVATVNPVGPEDVKPAETMEELLRWAEDKSDLYIEQVKAVKSALIYGTGILKVQYGEKKGFNIRTEPVMQETMGQVATGEEDMDGNPLMQEVQTGVEPVLGPDGQPQMQTVREEYQTYAGPIAEAVDIDNFFPDPLCSDISDARFVIHRVYRDRAHIEKQFASGNYHRPDDKAWETFLTEHASSKRMSEIGLSNETQGDSEKDLYALLELWTDDVVITIAGERGQGALLRVARNPFGHGEKPFIRIVDHIVPHEPWGIGELEPLEGIQDALNALWNSRIDNIKISMNTMFAVVMDYMMDPNDLVVRPGGVVRMREGLPLEQVFKQIDLGDVTGAAFQEADELKTMGETALGVSPYQTGQESPAYNRTATGVALISEQGNTRFSFKVALAEHTGYKRLVRQYASVLQQFCPDDLVLRIKGGEAEQEQAQLQQQAQMQIQAMVEQGADPMMAQQQVMSMLPPVDPMAGWQIITPDAIMGRFDFDIEAESSAQSVSVRREQTLSMAAQLMADPYMKPRPIREDLLKEFGRKNPDEYLYSDMEIQQMQMAAQQAESAESGGPPQEG